jgi:hypothetical protein
LASKKGKTGAAVVALFVLFGDRILSWYMGLSPWETWSGAGVVGLIMLAFIRFVKKHPDRIRPHRDAIKAALADIKFSLFAFVFVGLSDVFYNLDRFLFSFWMYPGPWIVLTFQAAFLVNIAGLEHDELNLAAKLGDFVWKRARDLIWQFRHRPQPVAITPQGSRLISSIERIVTFLAGTTYLVLTIGPMLLNTPSFISSWIPTSPLAQGDILLFCGGPFVAWMFSTSLSPRGARRNAFIVFYSIFLIGFLATVSFQSYTGQLH